MQAVPDADLSDPTVTGPASALPSVRARVIAFVSIMVAGGLGGAIGYWFIDLQCTGSCTVGAGFTMLAGTLILALGAAVVAVVSLRALGEWSARAHDQ